MPQTKRTLLQGAVAVELARRGLFQRDLARRLRVPDTTLSDWLRGAHPAPPDLSTRIEKALGMRGGELLAELRASSSTERQR
jgi:plasmid maintenance system antidote protein VapI